MRVRSHGTKRNMPLNTGNTRSRLAYTANRSVIQLVKKPCRQIRFKWYLIASDAIISVILKKNSWEFLRSI